MLFKNNFLQLIEEGKVQTAFRRWTRPTVKEGGTILTSVGQLRIHICETIDYKKISDIDILKSRL